MNKRLNLLLVLFLVFSLVACGKSTSVDPNNKTDVVDKEDNKNTVKEKPKEVKPKRDLPKNLPVYPKSYIIDDFEDVENTWVWVFYSSASANEIKEFFNDELSYLGLLLRADTGPILDVLTLEGEFALGLVEESDRTVDENTPNREYAVAISLDGWDESLTRDTKNDPRPKINLETEDSSKFGDFKPVRDVPKILPVYPGSILIDDGPTTITGTKWTWRFKTNARIDEIIEFYEKELKSLGIQSESHKEEGFLIIKDKGSIIEIMGMYIEDEEPEVNYRINVDLVALNDL